MSARRRARAPKTMTVLTMRQGSADLPTVLALGRVDVVWCAAHALKVKGTAPGPIHRSDVLNLDAIDREDLVEYRVPWRSSRRRFDAVRSQWLEHRGITNLPEVYDLIPACGLTSLPRQQLLAGLDELRAEAEQLLHSHPDYSPNGGPLQ